ncbi:MAG: hypothetical protein ACRC0G_07520 [Fusobacteriaceae bacterium]
MLNNNKKRKIHNERLESGMFTTEVICKDKSTGKELFKTKNKMVIGGALFVLQKMFNVNTSVNVPTLNNLLNIPVTVTPPFTQPGLQRENAVQFFCVGLDGSGDSFGSVVAVDYKSKGLDPDKIVPMRYTDPATSVPSEYTMKKLVNGKAAYYGKTLVNTPTIQSYFKDGTPVTSDISTSTKQDEIETFIEIRFDISKTDCREFFQIERGGVKNCRINTVGFYFGIPVAQAADGGRVQYAFAKCFSKINFNNEPLDDDVKELDFVYRIFIR